jgi:hypothetical protein
MFHHMVATMTLVHIVVTVILDHIVTMTLDAIVASYTISEFVISLVSLLTPLPVMWHKEHLWNFVVLQGVCLSNLVCFSTNDWHCECCHKNCYFLVVKAGK